MGISSPPSGSAGVVGCCESHKVLGLKGAGVSAAEAKVEGTLLAGNRKEIVSYCDEVGKNFANLEAMIIVKYYVAIKPMSLMV